MQPITIVLVSLDLTEMDDLLIQYTAHLCQTLKQIEKVYFAHNIKFDHADEAKDILNQLDKPLGELMTDSISEKLEDLFQNVPKNITNEIIVEENVSTPAALARLSKIHQVNLVITGKKLSYKGSGLVPEKLLGIGHFNASVLLVPETAYHRISNILVPTDFSKISKKAFVQGMNIKEQTKATISCQHVFSIQSFYFPAMMVQDFKPVLQKGAEKKWQNFKKGLTQTSVENMECELSFNANKNIAQTNHLRPCCSAK